MAHVLLQRGHCNRTKGSTGAAGEQKQVSTIAELAAPLLTERGHTVKMLLADDKDLPKADLFIALHCDGSIHPNAGGASVGFRNKKSGQAAAAWKTAYQRRGWPFGFRADNYTTNLSGYYGTRWARDRKIPLAYVVEFGFLTNPSERAWLTSPAGQQAAAASLLDAVGDVLGHPSTNHTDKSSEGADMIKKGDKGANVGKWQLRLNQAGYTPPLKKDGKFGDDTEKAVRWFQRKYGLDETGTIDLTTAVQLQAIAHGMAHHA